MAVASAFFPDAEHRHALSLYDFDTRHMVDHSLRAAHPSRRRGEGVEFHQFRPYQQGDDLRRIDWRLYGRSDKLFVRESDQDSRLTVVLVMDASASMGIGDENGVNRLTHTKHYVAALAWLAMHRQHDFAFVQLDANGASLLEPGGGLRHYQRLLGRLSAAEPSGAWRAGAIERLLRHLPPRVLLVTVSDFFEHDKEQTAAMQALVRQANSAFALQILLPNELDWQLRGQVEVVDAETGYRRLVSAGNYRRTYRRNMQQILKATANHYQNLGVRFCRVSSKTDQIDGLRALLSDRLTADQRLLVDVANR